VTGATLYRNVQNCPDGHDTWRFNPRPGHVTGATEQGNGYQLAQTKQIRSFNPRPGHVTGATSCSNNLLKTVAIYCFNPRPGHVTGATTRINASAADQCCRLFQSAPRSRDRGDDALLPWHVGKKSTITLFQSAPRSRDRGDARSPARVSARWLGRKFQSAPRSRDRGDSISYETCSTRTFTSFNPRPGHVTGATFGPPRIIPLRGAVVSIRAPVT
jgi:hypothetical protein